MEAGTLLEEERQWYFLERGCREAASLHGDKVMDLEGSMHSPGFQDIRVSGCRDHHRRSADASSHVHEARWRMLMGQVQRSMGDTQDGSEGHDEDHVGGKMDESYCVGRSAGHESRMDYRRRVVRQVDRGPENVGLVAEGRQCQCPCNGE